MQLNVDFQRVLLQAQQIEELAEMLYRACGGSLEEALGAVSQAWSGDCADDFLRKGMRFHSKIEKTAKDLRQTAAVVRAAAKQLYEIEQQAEQLAASRDY